MSTFEFMIHCFSLAPRHLKFQYDKVDCKWVDAYSTMSNVTIEFDLFIKIYSLNVIDAKSLDEFVGKS